MQIARRSFLALSAVAEAADSLEHELRDAEAGLCDVHGAVPGLLFSLGPDKHPDLRHRLSGDLMRAAGSAKQYDRSADERAMLALFARAKPFAGSADDFRASLCAANALVVPQAGLRRYEAGLPVTVGAIQVLFPEPSRLAARLEELHGFVKRRGSSVGTAIAVLAAMLNAHPFSDGNGRVARALYAHLLGTIGLSGHFPFAAVFHASRGSFDLCLREGEILGNWEPFVRYNARVLSIAARHGVAAQPE